MVTERKDPFFCKECGQQRGKHLNVYVDLKGKNNGTDHPIGTLRKPVNNFEDAVVIIKKLKQPNDELPPRIHLV